MSGSLDAFRMRADGAVPGGARPGWFVALGILLIATGVIAWIDVVAATLASTILIGLMLVVAGVVQVAHALAHRGAGGANPLLSGLIGVLYAVGGASIIAEPVRGSLLLTAFLAGCLVFAGVFRLAWAAGHRHMRHWWGLLLSGLVALGIGVLVYLSLPWSGLFLLGTLVAIELVVAGFSSLAFGLTHRNGAVARIR